jgi:hypothetical protein
MQESPNNVESYPLVLHRHAIERMIIYMIHLY